MNDDILKVEGLGVYYGAKKGLLPFGRAEQIRAVDGVSFSIRRGEILGLVGESGSGKTTTGRAIIGLAPVCAGRILFAPRDEKLREISHLTRAQFMPYRKKIQMIFQDPFNSLNPRMSVEQIVCEPLDIHFKLSKAQRKARTAELLGLVGLEADSMGRFPHEFSGGQRQRIGIARALAVEPEFIICDEPVSALDVSVQAQIINLLLDLRERLALTMLFVAHDIAVVEHVSERMIVMTDGKIVEEGESSALCANPKHPYTQKLLDAVPKF